MRKHTVLVKDYCAPAPRLGGILPQCPTTGGQLDMVIHIDEVAKMVQQVLWQFDQAFSCHGLLGGGCVSNGKWGRYIFQKVEYEPFRVSTNLPGLPNISGTLPPLADQKCHGGFPIGRPSRLYIPQYKRGISIFHNIPGNGPRDQRTKQKRC
jgi:hypothetical protein